MRTKDQLLVVANAYSVAARISMQALAHEIFKDNKKFAMILKGKDIRCDSFDYAMQWMSDRWPVGAKWPRDDDGYPIRRPKRVG
jgi:hypothetical protein